MSEEEPGNFALVKKHLNRKTKSLTSSTWVIILLYYIVSPLDSHVVVHIPFILILNLIVVEFKTCEGL